MPTPITFTLRPIACLLFELEGESLETCGSADLREEGQPRREPRVAVDPDLAVHVEAEQLTVGRGERRQVGVRDRQRDVRSARLSALDAAGAVLQIDRPDRLRILHAELDDRADLLREARVLGDPLLDLLD